MTTFCSQKDTSILSKGSQLLFQAFLSKYLEIQWRSAQFYISDECVLGNWLSWFYNPLGFPPWPTLLLFANMNLETHLSTVCFINDIL